MERSKIPLRKWVIGIYLMTTSLKGVSSMKLRRDLDLSQSSAWFMAQRIREGWRVDQHALFDGPVEADEVYIGGRPRRKGQSKRGRGTDKVAVIGIWDRSTSTVHAEPAENLGKAYLHDFIRSRTWPDAPIYTDEWPGYKGVSPFHETVRHRANEYARGEVHVNTLEGFWSMLRRGFHGVYHHWSKKHMARYVREFSGRFNYREHDTEVQMQLIALGMVGRRSTYRDLVGKPETRLNR